MGFMGIDVREANDTLIFRASLKDSDGAKVTAGTTEIRIYELQADTTLHTYDWAADPGLYDFTGAPDDDEGTMTHQQQNSLNTGIWTVEVSNIDNFVPGNIYIVQVTNSNATPESQEREFQYGLQQGDMMGMAVGKVATDSTTTLVKLGTLLPTTSNRDGDGDIDALVGGTLIVATGARASEHRRITGFNATGSGNWEITLANALTGAPASGDWVYLDPTARLVDVASKIQVDNIGAASGGAVNFAPMQDNLSGAIIDSVTKVGTVASGTFASVGPGTSASHSINDAGNDIDWVYGFQVGESRTATSIIINADVDGGPDQVSVKVYDHVGDAWDTIGEIDDNDVLNIPIVAKHTGTGSELGKVYVRFDTDATTPANLEVWECLVAAVANQGGITNGSTVTLAATTTNTNLVGNNWTLAMGGQSISNSYIKGATVTGTGTGSSVTFEDCHFAAGASIPAGSYYRCGFAGTVGSPVTESGTGQYVFKHCFSEVAGSGTPYFNFAGAGGTVGVNNRAWTGGFHFTGDTNVTVSHEVLAGGGTTIVTGGGNAEVRGICRSLTITLTATETVQFVGMTGSVTLGDDGNSTGATVNLWGSASTVTNGTTGATVNDYTSNVKQISGSETAADNAEIVYATDFGTNYSLTTDKWQVESDMLAISGDSGAANNLESYCDGGANMQVDVKKISTSETAANNLELYCTGDTPIPANTTYWAGTATTLSSTTAKPQVDIYSLSDGSTAADYLQSAAEAYSTTRGLAGTALPAVAAGATGGLPTVDSSNAVKVQSGTGANQISLSSGQVTVGTVSDGAIGAAAVADIFSTTALTEAYAADAATGTPAQLLYEILQSLTEFAIADTTITVKKRDGSTTAATFTIDSATAPTSRTRAT